MQTIWKFELDGPQARQTVKMPLGATILSVQMQNSKPSIWALVNDAEPRVGHRIIHVAGTGFPCPGLTVGQFLATVQAGPFVWHIFDLGWE